MVKQKSFRSRIKLRYCILLFTSNTFLDMSKNVNFFIFPILGVCKNLRNYYKKMAKCINSILARFPKSFVLDISRTPQDMDETLTLIFAKSETT